MTNGTSNPPSNPAPGIPDPVPAARVVRRRRIAPIWVLPLLALVVGGWLVYRSLLASGPRVTIEFESADGIVVNQTQVRYRGIPIGVVKQLEILDNLAGVKAVVEFDKKIPGIPINSQFWLVTPQISVSGISGLSTLFSGNYIGAQPGDRNGPMGDYFKALKQAPALPVTEPGLHIHLRAERLGSISPGTQVYYRQIPIGSVQSTRMADDGKGVILDIHILPEHAKFVHKSSRFFNSSGISISASLSGLRVETESLASVLAGGISMANIQRETAPSVNGDSFTLYPDYEAAEAGYIVTLRFPSAEGLSAGVTKVMYKGVALGKLLHLTFDETSEEVVAQVGLDPRIEPYVTDKTRFWLVKPQLSVAGVSGLDALFSGTYISLGLEREGQPKTDFVVEAGPSPLDYRAPGLHVLLTASKLGSLNQGSPVYYRQLQVGQVVSYTLDDARDKVDVHALIAPEYAHLINQSTRFWNASGIHLSAGLAGVEVRTESLASLLAGGIAFDTPDQVDAKAVGNGYRFSLFDDETSARNRLNVRLRFTSAEGLVEGRTRVLYRGLPIGQVEKVRVSKDFRTVEADVGFDQSVAHLLTENSVFWMVKPEVSINRISGLDALFSGTYIAIQPGTGKPKRDFLARNTPPPLPMSEPGLHVIIRSEDADSISVGAPVFYHRVTVGSIQNVRLSGEGKGVLIHAHINPEYAKHVTTATRFWNSGGLEFRAGAGGVRLRTESVAALIAGGISFDNFDTGQARATPAHSGDEYRLYSNRDVAENAGFPVSLHFTSGRGMRVGAPIRYLGLDIGEITGYRLDEDMKGVSATALVRPAARVFMRQGSQLWRVTAELGLARTANLETLATGDYVELRPGSGPEQFEFNVADREPVLTALPQGLNVVLESTGLGSLKTGDPVMFRQVRVGRIIGADLNEGADRVRIYVNIEPRYAGLVRTGTRFWQASGFAIDAGLFSGLQVKTESMEAVIAGGIAFATPGDGGAKAAEGARFELYPEAEPAWLKWQDNLGGR